MGVREYFRERKQRKADAEATELASQRKREAQVKAYNEWMAGVAAARKDELQQFKSPAARAIVGKLQDMRDTGEVKLEVGVRVFDYYGYDFHGNRHELTLLSGPAQALLTAEEREQIVRNEIGLVLGRKDTYRDLNWASLAVPNFIEDLQKTFGTNLEVVLPPQALVDVKEQYREMLRKGEIYEATGIQASLKRLGIAVDLRQG